MGELAFTWWGHASGVVEIGGTRVAMDPVFTRQLFHLRRRLELPGEVAAPLADLVLISHLHADHLHLPSLRRFPASTTLVVPRGAAGLLAALPQRVVEVAPGERLQLAGVGIEVLDAYHDGRRMPGSRWRAPALGFRLDDGTLSAWYPGDTGLFEGMEAVAPVDLALVPIGGWGPTLGEHHLNPVEAVEAVRRVGAQLAVPVHYGTLWPVGLEVARSTRRRLFFEPSERFSVELRRRLPAVQLELPDPGTRISFD